MTAAAPRTVVVHHDDKGWTFYVRAGNNRKVYVCPFGFIGEARCVAYVMRRYPDHNVDKVVGL